MNERASTAESVPPAAPIFAALARAPRSTPPWRYTVPGGGGLLLALQENDCCQVSDAEGAQAAWVFACDLAALALTPAEDVVFADLLPPDTAAGRPIHAALAALGMSPANLRGACVVSALAAPGTCWNARASRAVDAIILAPGALMAPHEQTPPTALGVELVSASPRAGLAPPPLALAKLDLRVPAGQARAYRVARGDYLQIIDVDGRQCSDFLAFDAAALAAGRERGIDATATRSVLGRAYAAPGLHAKYLDEDFQPLLEVVRDTVGRHDTFLLACAAKYYEDAGYPGHANCSTNFNLALDAHGVSPRTGWPAINFFYNTQVGPDGTIGMDEPWSRAGDYVLLRALTDLVCASSACPDDIDPANGWDPTDIHVRVYDAGHSFSRGVAHRMTPDSPPVLTRESGFHPRIAALTRNFVEYRGFWLPTCYTSLGPISEYWACRERAVIMDLSPLRKFEILGPDAETLTQLAITRDVRKLAVGQVVYSALCYEHGGMLDDCTVFRFGPANFRLVAGDDYVGVWLRQLAGAHGLNVRVKSATDQLHNCAVQGPASRAILSELVQTPAHQPKLAELGWFRFTIGRIGSRAVVVSRTGYTGELGYEVWCHPAHGAEIWQAIEAAGAPHGLLPFGLDALDMVRIEAGLVFAGYDFCAQTDPFEAGIGFTVPAGKTEPYVGAAALVRRREHPQRQLVGLDILDPETVAHGDPIYLGRAQIGVVTSATRSPILAKQIALARLDVLFAALGQELEIGKLDGHQKRLAARVVRYPHYDPDKTRVRA